MPAVELEDRGDSVQVRLSPQKVVVDAVQARVGKAVLSMRTLLFKGEKGEGKGETNVEVSP